MDANAKQIQPIDLLLDVEGDGLEKVCGYGHISIKTMTLSGGGSLKTARMIGDLSKMTLPFKMDPAYSLHHPAGALRAKFSVEPPADTSKGIAVLEGTFKIFTSDVSNEYVVEDAPRKALRGLAEPDLKAAGVKLLLIKADGLNGESLVLSCGKGHMLGLATVNPRDNLSNQMRAFVSEIDKGQTVQRLRSFDQSGKFPEKLEIKIVLHRDVKEHVVSFRFENAALPSLDSKPESKIQGAPPVN